MDINKELAELLGLRWYEATEGIDPEDDWKFIGDDSMAATMWGVLDNPDFTADTVSLLRLMMKRADWEKFLQLTGWMYFDKDTDAPIYYIKTDFITDTTGLLAQAAYCFLKNKA
jgi:hypothetical protein